MAFMNQERKKRIAEDLKKVIPADWKYSLKVRNHSTICLTIRQAPVDLLGEFRKAATEHYHEPVPSDPGQMYYCLNPYHWDKLPLRADLKKVFHGIFNALFKGNHDNSDPMTDYFDVGWYVDVQIGEWDNPFLHVIKNKEVA
jgi:hypothetical protein